MTQSFAAWIARLLQTTPDKYVMARTEEWRRSAPRGTEPVVNWNLMNMGFFECGACRLTYSGQPRSYAAGGRPLCSHCYGESRPQLGRQSW